MPSVHLYASMCLFLSFQQYRCAVTAAEQSVTASSDASVTAVRRCGIMQQQHQQHALAKENNIRVEGQTKRGWCKGVSRKGREGWNLSFLISLPSSSSLAFTLSSRAQLPCAV